MSFLINWLFPKRRPAPPPNPLPPRTWNTHWSLEVHPDVAAEMNPSNLAQLAPHYDFIRCDYVPGWGDALFDNLVAACEAAGLRILFITPYVPIAGVNSFDPYAYAQVCARGAARYAGKRIIWELMNEPNNTSPLGQGQLSVAQYLALVRTTAPAIHAADSSSLVITGGTSGVDYPFLRQLAPIYSLVDGVAVHPYGAQPSGFPQVIADVYALSGGRPVYLTEWSEPDGGGEDAARAAVSGYVPLYNHFRH